MNRSVKRRRSSLLSAKAIAKASPNRTRARRKQVRTAARRGWFERFYSLTGLKKLHERRRIKNRIAADGRRRNRA